MMKIPHEQEMFAPVQLSCNQEQQIKWLGDTLLEETLFEYDEFVHRHDRVLDKRHWKKVIARENLSIFKRTGSGELGGTTPDIDLFQAQLEPRSRYWRRPMCVGVGNLTGTLDDLLYGQLATTRDDTLIRSTYTKDDSVDTRVLATLVRPTRRDPLQAVLVRWTLLRQTLHNIFVIPRDVVHMESIGTRVLPNGERIGYIVVQSIDLPGCGELTHCGIVRASYSSCYIFRESGHGTIDMYMRAYMEPGGRLGDHLAVSSGCVALISIGRLMIVAQNKKLAYMMRNNLGSHQRRDMFTLLHGINVKTCSLCLKRLSNFRSRAIRCDLCHTSTCSRCIDKRKLSYVLSNGQLRRIRTPICKTCIATATTLCARDVAANEVVSESLATIRSYSNNTTVSWNVIDLECSDLRQLRDSISSGSSIVRDPSSAPINAHIENADVNVRRDLFDPSKQTSQYDTAPTEVSTRGERNTRTKARTEELTHIPRTQTTVSCCTDSRRY